MPSDPEATQLQATFAPIGGFPSSVDIAPTITFIALYGCLVPLCILRISSPKSRNVVQLPIVAAIVERILNLTVRLLQATGKWPWTSATLLEYQQLTLEWGWIALAHAMVAFWRSVAVNATRPDVEKGEGEDQKKMRKRIKKVTYAFDGSYWVAQLLGVGAAICWRISLHDGLSPSLKAKVDGLRYSAIILAMILILASAGGALWTRNRMQGADKQACSYLVYLYLSLLVVPIYRLTQYPSFSSSNLSKTLFYIFHLTPELLVSVTLVALNTRQVFRTGPWGDYYFSWRKGWTTPSAALRKRKRRLRLVTEERKSWRWSSNRSSTTVEDDTRTEENEDVEILIPKDSEGRPTFEDVRQVKHLPAATLRSSRLATFSRHDHPDVAQPPSPPPMRERTWRRLDRPSSYVMPSQTSRVPSPPSAALVRDDHGHGSFCYNGSLLP